jgi:hypothetical protein
MSSLNKIINNIALFSSIFLTSCSYEKEKLEWIDFPIDPRYTIEEQIHYLQNYPPGFGKPKTYINDENKISSENLEFLIKFAEKKLSYKDLNSKSGEELLLITSHITQKLLKTCSDFYECNIFELAKTKNNQIIDYFKENKKSHPAFCINYTLLNMEIFNGFKNYFPELNRYEFLPLDITRIKHTIQGFYDKKENKITLICGYSDDLDSKFNSGKHKLNWTEYKADIMNNDYIDFIIIMKDTADQPYKRIEKLKEMKDKNKFIENNINYYLAKSYSLIGEKKRSNELVREIARTDHIFAGTILKYYKSNK